MTAASIGTKARAKVKVRRMLAPAARAIAGGPFEGPAYRLWHLISGASAKNEEYDRLTVEVIRRVLGKDSNAVDVGAHRGTVLRPIVEAAPDGEHLAIEPLPAFATALRKGFPRVEVAEVALSSEPGRATFNYVVSNPSYSGLAKRSYPDQGEVVEELTVDRVRLDDLVPPDRPVHFLKIDVEGSEADVLAGARKILARWQPVVVFEHGWDGASPPPKQSTDRIWSELLGAGLSVFELDRWLAGAGPLTRDELDRRMADGEYYFLAAPGPSATGPRALIIDVSSHGGIARYSECLATALKQVGNNVQVAAPSGLCTPSLELSSLRWGPELERLPRRQIWAVRLGELPRAALSVIRVVRRAKPEIVHMQSELVPGLDHLVMRWMSRRAPVVLTVHDPIPHGRGATYAARQARRWRCADALIVHGEEPRQFVESSAPGVPVYVIPVDLPLAVAPVEHELARRTLGLDDAPMALLLGELRPSKGLGLLVETWPLVVKVVPSARLYVVGRGHPSDELERLAALDGVVIRTEFMTDDSELDLWAAAADVMVLPYHFGSHSGILHRAVAARTPAIVSPPLSEEAHRSRAGKAYPLVAGAWAPPLVAALENPTRSEPRLGVGRRTAEMTLALYRDVLSKR